MNRVPCAAGYRGGGKVEILFLDFHFSTAIVTIPRECGNRAFGDFQGLWETRKTRSLGFPRFPWPVISSVISGFVCCSITPCVVVQSWRTASVSLSASAAHWLYRSP
jgi:hypothetical protein